MFAPGLFLRWASPTPHELGAAAERWVARRLARRGMRLLARRVETPLLEVDLVAIEVDTLVALEVKAGRGSGVWRPGLHCDARRLGQLVRAARFLRRRLGFARSRVDLVEVFVGRGAPRLAHHRALKRPLRPTD